MRFGIFWTELTASGWQRKRIMDREFATLSFRKARLNVRLGCSEKERRLAQQVDLDLSIRFLEPPPACKTDQVDQTVCYDELIKWARSYCEGKEFRLIEKLAHDLFKCLKAKLPPLASLWIQTTKVNPPVEELYGGASFSFGDFQPN